MPPRPRRLPRRSCCSRTASWGRDGCVTWSDGCGRPTGSRATRSTSSPGARSAVTAGGTRAEPGLGAARSGSSPGGRIGPSGCSAAWIAHLTGGQGVAGSNPASPTAEQATGLELPALRNPGVGLVRSWERSYYLRDPKKGHILPQTRQASFGATPVPGDTSFRRCVHVGGSHAECRTQVRRRRPSEATAGPRQQQVGGLYPLIPGPVSSPAAAAALPSVMARSAGPSERRLPLWTGPRTTTNCPQLTCRSLTAPGIRRRERILVREAASHWWMRTSHPGDWHHLPRRKEIASGPPGMSSDACVAPARACSPPEVANELGYAPSRWARNPTCTER